jgi:hypothetical protein
MCVGLCVPVCGILPYYSVKRDLLQCQKRPTTVPVCGILPFFVGCLPDILPILLWVPGVC